MTTPFRTTIPDFELANPLYVGATVTFFTVDSNGHATTTLAPLYADASSNTTVSNPQTLDGLGKFVAPVYVQQAVIASVVGPNVPSHQTGAINGIVFPAPAILGVQQLFITPPTPGTPSGQAIGAFTIDSAIGDNSNNAFGISGGLSLNVFSGGSSGGLASTNPTVFIARTETINGPTTSQSAALLVVAFGKGNTWTGHSSTLASQTQAIAGFTNKDAASTGDSVAVFGIGDNFGSNGTAFGGFFQATNHGNSTTLNSIAIETGTVNGAGVDRPYNPTPGTVPANMGLDISYAGTADGSATANGGPAIQIRASPGQWDVGIGFMNGSPIKKAELQSDTNAISLYLANSGSHTFGLNWTGASFATAAIATPGFTLDGSGTITSTSTNGHSLFNLTIRNTTGINTILTIDTTTAGKTALIAWEDAGNVKWYLGKDTDLAFILNDNVLGKTILRAASNNGGRIDFGVTGSQTGAAGFAGATSGMITLKAQAAAGTWEWDWPTSAGSSGSALLSGGGAGTPMTWTAGALAIASGKTLTANSTLTLAGTDGKTLTVSNSGTLAGGDGFTLAIAASKTLTVSNSLTFAGTDGKTLTVNASLTLAGTDAKTLTVSNSGTLAGGDGFTLAIAAAKTLTVSNSLTLAGTDGKTLTLTNSLTVTTNDGTLAFGAASKTLTINNSLTLAGTDGKTVTHNASTTFAGTDGKTLTISNSGTLSGGDGFTLSIAANKTLTASNSLTLAGTDGKTLTLTNGLTVSGNDGTLSFGAASKTLTVNNSLTLAGTDATTMTFPGTSQTIAGLGVAQTFTLAQTIAPTIAANTASDGLILSDTTAATAGNQQYAPALHLVGRGWQTTTPQSEAVEWQVTLIPVQSTTHPQAFLNFASNINGAGFNNRFQVVDDGVGNVNVNFLAASGKSVQFSLGISGTGNVGVFYADATQVIGGSLTAVPVIIKANNTEVARFPSGGGQILANGTAIPAGGTAALGYMFSSTANFGVFFGSGAPTLSAAKGSLYLRSDGTTTNNRAYINTDGGTTWTALTTAA